MERTVIHDPCVYFARVGDTGPIKIGTTTRLGDRRKLLRTRHGKGLRIVSVIPGGKQEELALHYRFAGQRRKGEWFDPSSELLRMIEDLPPFDGGDVPDCIRVVRTIDAAILRVRLSPEVKTKLKSTAAIEGLSIEEKLHEILCAYLGIEGVVAPVTRSTLAFEPS